MSKSGIERHAEMDASSAKNGPPVRDLVLGGSGCPGRRRPSTPRFWPTE